MTKTTLNKCLNKLDAIFIGYNLDNDVILTDIEDIRSRIINISKLEMNQNKSENFRNTVMVIIQFINYMINVNIAGSVTGTLPMSFLNQINALRKLILMFECGDELIIEEEIDFDKGCDAFINKYITKNQDEE